jgi:hypothetical protein
MNETRPLTAPFCGLWAAWFVFREFGGVLKGSPTHKQSLFRFFWVPYLLSLVPLGGFFSAFLPLRALFSILNSCVAT